MDFKGFLTGAAALTLVAVMPLSASAGSQMVSLSLSGSGTSVVTNNIKGSKCYAAGLVCNKGDLCECVEQTGTTVMLGEWVFGGNLNDASFDNLFSVDRSESLNTGTGNECFSTAGLMSFTSNGNSIQAFANGFACNAGGPPVKQGLISGEYSLTNGTEELQGITGVGTFSSALIPSTGATILQMTGNVVGIQSSH